MGLGKTIQALAAITHLKNVEDASHFLVVCPASIVGNWIREINSRASIPLRLLHGDRRYAEHDRWQQDGGIAVTSYEMLSSFEDLARTPIHLLISDEAHYIKNPRSQRSGHMQRLASASDRVVLMTGTPLENHPREFVNLVRVCDASLSNVLAREVASNTGSQLNAKRFETAVAPVYLRRNQKDVLRELPDCIEIDEWVTPSLEDRNAYAAAVASHNVMAMRQAANGDSIRSAKLCRLAELVEAYRETGGKMVIFSYFLGALDLIGESLGEHFRIDGSVPASRRIEVIDDFSHSSGFAALVCQILAGGVGINLQAASSVVLLEPQYKPTSEWQAIKRVHRMGQSNRVVVHRLLARDTVDESLRTLMGRKVDLFNNYAQESAIKDASPAATDTSDAQLERRLLEIEITRQKNSLAG
jgi:SNF2 family DNA or RNA helicase